MSRAPLDETCPGEDEIAAFLRGRLAAPRRRLLDAHVAGCVACRQLLSALAQAATDASAEPSIVAARGDDAEAARSVDERIGRYVVLDWLGAGGMGVVYVAHDPELDRKVALKVLRSEGNGRSQTRDELLREARAMAQLAHPNVVSVFDVGSVDERVFIAMELVAGLTLAQWLRAAPRPRSEILEVFRAAGSGLLAAHAAGLIHRDFKPDNVLIGNDGRVRVTDFGLARAAPPSGGHERSAELGATHSGIAGTLAYMAPEQYLGRPVDARADQFSFAVALHEALYGERPFAPLQLADPDLVDIVPAPLRGDAVHPVLVRALRLRADQRFPSMAELLAALAPRPRRKRFVAGAVVLIASLALGVGGYAAHLRSAAEQRTKLVGRMRGLAPELRTTLRSAHMLPLHDIRPARAQIRTAMQDVERERPGAGDRERGLIDFVLGEGHRALGEDEPALARLEAAWQAGERGPHIDTALGFALGAIYERQFEQVDQVVESSDRARQLRALEARYRDPAREHLRAALAAGDGSPEYLEAVIAFHEHRFADASRLAHAAFTASPTLYEAGTLEANAHNEAGRALLAEDQSAQADAKFADARQTFAQVLEIARSDDDAWLAYGQMVYAQASALSRAELPAALRDATLGALRTARQINPDQGEAYLREAQLYGQEANIAIIWYRDPGPAVDQAVQLANEARARGSDADRVDVLVCVAHWTRAVYQGSHAVDPHGAFDQAIAACQQAATRRPDADKYSALGVVYSSLALYDADHGRDPTPAFTVSERNLRAAIAIADSAVLHHNLGRLWVNRAHYEQGHGGDPEAAVARALAELATSVRMDATRTDALAAMADALIARARFQRATNVDPQPTLAQARGYVERALATEPALVPPVRNRIALAELEAESQLARGLDPRPAVARMRADTQTLLDRLPDDAFALRFRCRAELIAARWALGHHEPTAPVLARAEAAAARARASDALNALGWTASAEVEAVRAEAARLAGSPSRAVVERGLVFVEQAMKIDPRLVRTLEVRDALARSRAPRVPAASQEPGDPDGL